MADTERGAYTPPTDAPLSFDARQPVRGARPIPFTLIISALVLVGLVVAIVMFYRSGVRQAGEPPQTVGAPIGEIKAAAASDAQPEDPAAGLQIYKAEGAPPADDDRPIFTAPPEAPQPRPQPAPVVVTPPPAAPVTTTTLRPAIPAASAPATPPAPAPVAKAPTPAPAAKTVAAAPAPKAPAVGSGVPKPAPVAAAKTPAPAAGGAVVQIGAVSSQALADKTWNEAVAAAPGLAAGKGKSVEKIDKNGATLFRTAVTGFADREQATAFCNRLKAAGKSCFVR